MLFHARALAAEDCEVDLIGTAASALPAFISGDRRIHVHTIADHGPAAGARSAGLRYLVRTVLRGARLLTALASLLCWRLSRPDVILVQNPPGVPTMAVAWLAATLRSTRYAVDWHNLTSAMLAMRLSAGHPLVRVVARYEGLFGRAADANLFVSSHMQQMLGQRFGVSGTVLRDRPADTFTPLSADERARVRARLSTRLAGSNLRRSPCSSAPRVGRQTKTSTCFSRRCSNTMRELEPTEARMGCLSSPCSSPDTGR